MKTALDQNSGILKIFGKTFKIFKDNFLKIIAVIFLYILIAVTVFYLFSFAASSVFSQSEQYQTTINNDNLSQSTSISESKIIIYKSILSTFLYSIAAILVKFIIFLSLLRIIDKKEKVFKALSNIFKKILPITFALIVLTLSVYFIPSLIFSMPLVLAFVPNYSGLFVILFEIILLILFIFLFLRLLFCVAISTLEKKYYFEAIKLSFKYSKGNILALLWKLFVPVFIYFAITYTIFLILPMFNMNILSNPFAHYILNIIATPILIIYYYLVYNIYKKDFENKN